MFFVKIWVASQRHPTSDRPLTLKQKPGNPQIRYLIAITQGNKGEYQKALNSIDQALWLKPDFNEALIIKGILLTKLGRDDEAKLCTEKLLETKKEPEKPAPVPAPVESNPAAPPSTPRYYFQREPSTTQNSNQ